MHQLVATTGAGVGCGRVSIEEFARLDDVGGAAVAVVGALPSGTLHRLATGSPT